MENNQNAESSGISKTTKEDNSVTVVSVNGELDLKLAHTLQGYLEEQISSMSAGQQLYIDLGNVDYIASTGVGAFSAALILATKKQVKFYICNLKPKVRSVFSILGLTSYFTEKNPDADE